MKVYTVKPGDPDIRCSDGRMIAADGIIAWGVSDTRAAFLSLALLLDVLGDRQQATVLCQRFKWRTVAKWNKDAPKGITEDEIRAIVKDIRGVEQDKTIAAGIAKGQREKPLMVSDRPGPGQVWDSNPEITPNKVEPKNGGK